MNLPWRRWQYVRGSVGGASKPSKPGLGAGTASLCTGRAGIVPTAIPELDRLLGGGFPAGAVATLEGATGRWSLAAGLAAGMTRRGLVAILDDGSLYPPALAEAGACLERVLVVPARKALRRRARGRHSAALADLPAGAHAGNRSARCDVDAIGDPRAPQRRALDRDCVARRRRTERRGRACGCIAHSSGFAVHGSQRAVGDAGGLRALHRRAQA